MPKISQLSSVANITNDDLFVVLNDPSGTPSTRKVTAQGLLEFVNSGLGVTQVSGGGTGATNDADARTNLGLAIGTNVQAYSATLAAVAGGSYSGDDSIVTLGTVTTGTWSASTIAVNKGGTGATTLTGYVRGNGTNSFTASNTIQGSDIDGNIAGNAANVTGVVAVANGGTGATNAAAARTNLQVPYTFGTGGTSIVAWQSGDNISSGNWSAVAAGRNNTSGGNYSVVAGGSSNASGGIRSAVGGGAINTSSGHYATVGGGLFNTASGRSSTVGGGEGAAAGNNFATVGGGYFNTASGYGSVVAGGGRYNAVSFVFEGNTAVGDFSAVGGGAANRAEGFASAVSGGEYNASTGSHAATGGGRGNTASGYYSAVGGGNLNTSSGTNSAVGGGFANRSSGGSSAVGGGALNTSDGTSSVVSGGERNTSLGLFSAVSGGHRNTAAGGASVVAGGGIAGNFTVTIASPGVFTMIGHGLVANDTIRLKTTGALPTGLADYTTYHVISAGLDASSFRVSLTQGGAAVNTSGTQSGTHTLWGLTTSNIASGNGATIGGGAKNAASGAFAGVSGGLSNTASGKYATIPGGTGNTATHSNVFLLGSNLVSGANDTTYVENLNVKNVLTLSSPLDVANGGTGATNTAALASSLGFGTLATQNMDNVTITGGTISLSGLFNVGLSLSSNSFSTAKVSARSPITNFKSVGEVSIFTVPSGYMFMVDTMEIVTTSVSGAGVAPAVRFGISGSEDMFYVASRTTSNSFGGRHVIENPQDGADAGSVVTFGITEASTATSHNGVAVVTGYLLKKS